MSMRTMKDRLASKFWPVLPVDRAAKDECARERDSRGLVAHDDERHLRETAAWLCRAQDATPDDGVSRAFKAAAYKGYGPMGWQASYPETTGYIIPTMFALAAAFNDDSYSDRALRMAQWEIDIQLPAGAVMGSVVTAPPSPAVFNTGQVVFGWLAAYRQNGEQKFLDAAKRAGEYLVSIQTEDGGWRKGDSQFAQRDATTYNTRVAWAQILLGLETGDERYTASGRRNIEMALSRQQENGWFADNCLNDPKNPLLHTIVYATRGILEAGIVLSERRFIAAALKSLDALVDCQRPDGGLAGRFDANWSPAVNWDCVTGDAQLAIAWLRAAAHTGDSKYREPARRAIEFVKKTQNLEHENPGIRGGVKGSFPFAGLYGQFEMLNWAAKFFCDALLLINDKELAQRGIGS